MRGSLFTLFLLSGMTLGAQELKVDFYKDSFTDFSKYRTYFWASQIEKELDENNYFLGDLVLKADIRDAVRSELGELGYRMSESNPDLIVNFRVIDRKANLHGFEGYGTRYWSSDEYRPAEDKSSFNVDAGTLIISLIDRKSGVRVWQGFVSGLMDDTNEFIKEEGKIREAVQLVIDAYGIPVNEYTRR